MSANKTIIADVHEQPLSTLSGVPLDVMFSGSSVGNRIVNSPFLVGCGSRVLEQAERTIVDMYFN
jgi:hypothetical protein